MANTQPTMKSPSTLPPLTDPFRELRAVFFRPAFACFERLEAAITGMLKTSKNSFFWDFIKETEAQQTYLLAVDPSDFAYLHRKLAVIPKFVTRAEEIQAAQIKARSLLAQAAKATLGHYTLSGTVCQSDAELLEGGMAMAKDLLRQVVENPESEVNHHHLSQYCHRFGNRLEAIALDKPPGAIAQFFAKRRIARIRKQVSRLTHEARIHLARNLGLLGEIDGLDSLLAGRVQALRHANAELEDIEVRISRLAFGVNP